MRTLHLIPIVHNSTDLGSLARPVEEGWSTSLGEETLQSFRVGVQRFWINLGDVIRKWQVDFEALLLYQDSIPWTGSPLAEVEHKIVADLANQGSQNHQILQWLIDQGATLIGTESLDLLLEEYKLAKERLQLPTNLHQGIMGDAEAREREAIECAAELLNRRDKFIAERIDHTLQRSQKGLLFIGLMHRVESHLPSDINVLYPFGIPRIFPNTSESRS